MTDSYPAVQAALDAAAQAVQAATVACAEQEALLTQTTTALEVAEDNLALLDGEVTALKVQVTNLQAALAKMTPDVIRDLGADPTGVKESTAALQKAIDLGLPIPAGRYLIDPLVSLKPLAGAKVVMDAATVLVLKPNGSDRYYGIRIEQPGVTVQGGQIAGDRDAHDFSSGGTQEHGMGIGVVNGGDGATIEGTRISGCTGDGICIGGGAKNITLRKVVSTGNRRQGLSVTNASEVLAEDCEFTDTHGTSPECGVDVEPDSPNSASRVTLRRCRMANNAKYGVNVFARASNVTIEDCVVEDNKSCGVVTTTGSVNTVIYGGTIQRNGATGIKAQTGTAGISISAVTFFDNYRSINDKDRVDFDASGTSTANYRSRDILIETGVSSVSVGLNHYL